ncbi:MAG: prepilin-type N-terminal cleavage/methylation domain-containing protein [Nitrospira sp.]|nr:prepilin-type N-terminal cleavage/methylation domain-containing protein [Nitrospira sp.]
MKHVSNQTGFTLLELLIALVILSVGLLGLAGLHIAAIKGNVSGFKFSAASAVAQQRLEELKAIDTASSALSPGNHNDGNVIVQGITYNRSYAVADNSPVRGTSTLTFTITWVEPVSGVTRTSRIFTRILKGA